MRPELSGQAEPAAGELSEECRPNNRGCDCSPCYLGTISLLALQQNLWAGIVTVMAQVIDSIVIILARGRLSFVVSSYELQGVGGVWGMNNAETKGSLSLGRGTG